MKAATLLDEVQEAGIRLSVEGAPLIVQSHHVPSDLEDRLRGRNAELIALLTSAQHPQNPQTAGTGRDFVREALEEVADGLFYLGAALLAARRPRGKGAK